MAFERQSNAADALTNIDINDIKRVSNANIQATENWSKIRQSLQTNNPNHITYMNIDHSSEQNAENPKYPNAHNYINSFLSLWRPKQLQSNPTEQTDIYENMPSLMAEPSYLVQITKRFQVLPKKKPKPSPKPIILKNEIKSLYANVPDDIKLMHENIYEGVREKSGISNEKYARKSFSDIYTCMDFNKTIPVSSIPRENTKPETSRKSNMSVSSGSLYVDMIHNPILKNLESKKVSPGCHFRGSVGCIHENNSLYYSIYELKPEAMRNNEYPFERTKQKLDRLPCFCNRKRKEVKSCEIYYSCENFNQVDVGIRSDESNVEDLNEQVDLPNGPFEEDTSSKRNGKSDRVKNVLVKKINQLAQLLLDWDTSI